jgi:hypothetical protein
MPNSPSPKFACEHCGKRHTWKPQLAGKRAKCTCGATIIVPASAPGDNPDDLYDIATAPAPVPTFAPAVAAPPQPGSSPTLAYCGPPTQKERERDSGESLISPGRDVYAPIVVLILGLVGLNAWASYVSDGSVLAMVLASVIWSFSTLVKTAILLGLAFVYAPRLGIGFGDLKTGILKFAAIVIFTDALDLWAIEAFTREHTTYTVRRIGLEVLIAAISISVLCHILFEMDSEETAMFALPVAVVSKVLSFLMNIAIAWLLGVILSPAATPPAAISPAGGSGTAQAAPATAPSIYSESDVPDIKPNRAKNGRGVNKDANQTK